MNGVIDLVQNDKRCLESLCNENFYNWTDAQEIFDEDFDLIRIMMEQQGITLESSGG